MAHKSPRATTITSRWNAKLAPTILDAQADTVKCVDFYVARANYYEQFRNQLAEMPSEGSMEEERFKFNTICHPDRMACGVTVTVGKRPADYLLANPVSE
jgi:hypothetical protein